jgi:hypothetical protein
MNINESNLFERKPEHIPTLEEVHSVFKELTNQEYKEVRKCEDEKGLYLLEITVPGDSPDEVTEYTYMRQGHYPEGQSATTEIHVVYYKNNIPISGTSAARYVEGNWKIL